MRQTAMGLAGRAGCRGQRARPPEATSPREGGSGLGLRRGGRDAGPARLDPRLNVLRAESEELAPDAICPDLALARPHAQSLGLDPEHLRGLVCRDVVHALSI